MNKKEFEKLKIRYSNEEDGEYLLKWFEEPGILRWFPCQEQKEIDDTVKMLVSFSRWKCALTAEYDGVPVGFGVLYLHAYKKIAHQCLFGMIVDQEYRNKGIGTQLILHLYELAKQNFNVETLYLEVFEGNPAISLYRRMGFNEVGYQRKWLKEDDGNYRSKITMERVL
ncbi:MAG: hypothetical protein S4CHLAM7_12040 [Chlamydiae bacterium]|nr:hypothetical protein [Chlamydiota bacterium]